MSKVSNKSAYRFLLQQRELIEREYQAHLKANGHDAETCIMKAEIANVNRQLDAVMQGKINE